MFWERTTSDAFFGCHVFKGVVIPARTLLVDVRLGVSNPYGPRLDLAACRRADNLVPFDEQQTREVNITSFSSTTNEIVFS